MAPPFDLSLGLEDTKVLVTGGCGLVGRVVVDAFLAAKCQVLVVDLQSAFNAVEAEFVQKTIDYPGNIHFIACDITDPVALSNAFDYIEKNPVQPFCVQCCVALASLDLSSLPQTSSIVDADPNVWKRVFDVNINGTFNTAQRWLQGIKRAHSNPAGFGHSNKLRNASLILMGSESGKFGVQGCAAYAAGKSAVQYGLLQSLAKDVSHIWPKARVNAVAPGAVDTSRFKEETELYGNTWRWEECEATVPMAKPVPVEDVARTILFLASEKWSGSTHGQVLHVDGGKTGSMVWKEGERQGLNLVHP